MKQNENLDKVENILFENSSNKTLKQSLPLLFILGSPRTGSNLLYQFLINCFELFYFTNFINDNFSSHPLIGSILDDSINHKTQVSYKSRYGKTKGDFGPSEASFIFRNWFGGAHPSQTKSNKISKGKRLHMINTLKSIYSFTGKPILTKNAWNCFRIKELTDVFPNSHFIWVRRDIRKSALSDLESRFRKGSPNKVWNSATPSNYKNIQKKPYWEQVVEQQYEYNNTISKDLKLFARDQFHELWYENLCSKPKNELEILNNHFKTKSIEIRRKKVSVKRFQRSEKYKKMKKDYRKIVDYINKNDERFADYIFREKEND